MTRRCWLQEAAPSEGQTHVAAQAVGQGGELTMVRVLSVLPMICLDG